MTSDAATTAARHQACMGAAGLRVFLLQKRPLQTMNVWFSKCMHGSPDGAGAQNLERNW